MSSLSEQLRWKSIIEEDEWRRYKSIHRDDVLFHQAADALDELAEQVEALKAHNRNLALQLAELTQEPVKPLEEDARMTITEAYRKSIEAKGIEL